MEDILDLQFKGLKIYQDQSGYCFTSDSVLLANYVKCKPNDTVVEFCAGGGVISILLSAKQNPNKIYAFEIQKRLCDMFAKSVEMNNLQNKILPINDRLENCLNYLKPESADVVFCNPPYHEGGDKSDNAEIAIAMHEVETSLASIIQNANRVLKYGGKFYMVHRVERLVDVFTTLRANKIEPKKLSIIYPKIDFEPVVFLVSATKGGKKGLKVGKIALAEDFNKSVDIFN